jgi:O-antigen/teichoic acid export membrane protein
MIELGLGTFVVAMYGSPEDVGFFAVASALVLKVLALPDSIETVMLPRIAADHAHRVELVAQSVRIAALLTGLAIAGIVAVSVPLVDVLFSPRFLPSVPLIWAMGLGVFTYAGSQMLMNYFRTIDRPGVCSLATWAGFVANAVVLLALYPVIGLHAAAWGMTAGFAARSIVLFTTFRQLSGPAAIAAMRFRRDDLATIVQLFRRQRTAGAR